MLSLVAALLVILTTGFWAFQGLFSAVIMLCETILALMTAFSFYEPLANYWKDSWSTETSEPFFLFILFLVTLGALRFLSDKYIPGNIRAHQLVDRIGGGVFGLFTGLILVGVLLICVQMLPLGRTTFGFDRINPKTNRANTLWFNPDGFTLGLLNMLSDERFAWGDYGLEQAKPDMLTDLSLRRSGTQVESRKMIPADSMDLLDVYRVPQIKEREIKREGADFTRDTTKIADKRDMADTYLVCRVALKQTANEAATAAILFTPAQFRIVGPRPGNSGHVAPHVYFACGMSDIYIPPPYDRSGGTAITISKDDAESLVRMNSDTPLVLNTDRDKALMNKDNNFVIDVVFEVPSEGFDPWYIEFKQGARRVIPANKKIEQRTAPSEASEEKKAGEADEADEAKPAGKQSSKTGKNSGKPKVIVGEAPKGRTNVIGAKDKDEGTGVYDTLPVPLPKSDAALNGKLVGDKFHNGHFAIELPDTPPTGADAVTKFDVPAGKKLVQLRVDRYFAGSFLGSALEYAKNVLNQYFMETADGTKYWARGYYIMGTFGGKKVLELQFWYEPDEEERCLEETIRLHRNILKQNPGYEMGYIFVVDPGAKIVRFHTSARSAQDCRIDVPN